MSTLDPCLFCAKLKGLDGPQNTCGSALVLLWWQVWAEVTTSSCISWSDLFPASGIPPMLFAGVWSYHKGHIHYFESTVYGATRRPHILQTLKSHWHGKLVTLLSEGWIKGREDRRVHELSRPWLLRPTIPKLEYCKMKGCLSVSYLQKSAMKELKL